SPGPEAEHPGWVRVFFLLLLLPYLALLTLVSWQPFDFRTPPAAFNWMPGLPAEYGSDLFALEACITKAVIFAPLGVALAAACRRFGVRPRLLLAAAFGAATAAVFEAGQLYLPSHVPCLTDVILGGFGAFAGAWVTARIETSGPTCTTVGG